MKKIFALLFLFLFSAKAFCAGVQGFYLVDGMKVSAVASSSSMAKKRALEEAREKAFNIVLSRLLISEDLPKVIMPDNYNMEKFVQAIKLNNEKTTSSSYSADVNIQINKNLMIEYLKNQGFSIVADVPPLTLIVFKGGDDFAFSDNIGAENIVPVMVYLSSNFSFDVDDADLSKFRASIPSVNNAVVVDVVANSNGNYTISVKDKLFGIDEEVIADSYSSVPHAVLQVINDGYKSAMQNNNGEYISLLIPVYSLSDWIDLQGKLSKLSSFKDMEIQALIFTRVQLKIKYNYDLSSVISALSSLGLSVENKGSYLIIKR
ncbi:MAG: hypothetical protein IKP65_01825 [Alphaproteobacteria bacterium]|nr:hypothetical protein [Alphaproteobacteria bacterium]